MFNELIAWQSQVPSSGYERLNKCPVCMCELYPDPWAQTDVQAMC